MKRALPTLLLALTACGGGASGGLSEIVDERLAALEPALELPLLPASDPDVAREVRAMAGVRAGGDEAARAACLVDARAIGDGAVAPLTALARDFEADPALRVAACELLGAVATLNAAHRLMGLADEAPEPWLRSQAIYQLGRVDQDRWVIPLVRRLRYEKDPGCVVWTMVTLARWSNYCAVDTVRSIAAGGGPGAEDARRQLTALEEQLGLTAAEIVELWNSPPGRGLTRHEPSDALLAELWTMVPWFSGDTFQLRPVDDSRFTLSRLGPWAANQLALALSDTDPYIRLHGSQVLERMGPRAVAAAPALLALLDDPLAGPAAAEALGRLGDPAAERALLAAAAAGKAHELRNAAVRALGRLRLAGSLATIVAVHDEAQASGWNDLRMTAATARVLHGDGDAVARWLVERLDGQLDATEAEVALSTWLRQESDAGRAGFASALGAWQLLGPRPGAIPSTEDAIERRARRAELMSERIDGLLD